MNEVFVAGGTGYLGRPLIQTLIAKGLPVHGVARPQSLAKLPAGCEPVSGDVLDSASYQNSVPAGSTFVHLVGAPHPAPWKGAEFRAIDLISLQQSVTAAKQAGVRHFIFVSVAHPAPAMRAYIEVRMHCEDIIRESGLNATIVRPWYILGPGHRWPYLLLPIYRLLERIPATREGAVRLGLVTHSQMINALSSAVASPGAGVRVMETAAIRAAGRL